MTPPDDPDDTRDDEVEDPQLRQLRSVWVSMRDEEPSDRGLAALMAAARDKADTLKPPEAWWQRALAMLRRPPVLALATVTVLLGGAIVVARHGDALKSEPTGTATTAAPQAERARGEPEELAPSPTETPPTAPVVGGASAPGAMPDPAPSPQPPATTATATVAPAHRKHDTAPSRQQRPELAEPMQHGAERPGDGLVIATGAAPAMPPPPATARLDDDRAVGQATATVTEKASAASPAAPRQAPSPTPTSDQLVKQCEAAAARGDCRTVQRLAAEIAKADPGAYRARIAKNAQLARCLE